MQSVFKTASRTTISRSWQNRARKRSRSTRDRRKVLQKCNSNLIALPYRRVYRLFPRRLKLPLFYSLALVFSLQKRKMSFKSIDSNELNSYFSRFYRRKQGNRRRKKKKKETWLLFLRFSSFSVTRLNILYTIVKEKSRREVTSLWKAIEKKEKQAENERNYFKQF